MSSEAVKCIINVVVVVFSPKFLFFVLIVYYIV